MRPFRNDRSTQRYSKVRSKPTSGLKLPDVGHPEMWCSTDRLGKFQGDLFVGSVQGQDLEGADLPWGGGAGDWRRLG